MAKYDIAHIHEQGQDIIIVPMKNNFGNLSIARQQEEIAFIQQCAEIANLRGTVVPVWRSGARTQFIAPRPWHPLFRNLTWQEILANINGTLSC